MTYKYRAYTKDGVLTKGEIQANDEKEAKAKLKSQSLLVETLTEKKEISFLRATIPNEILIPISRDLSLYIRAGIPISQALKLIRNKEPDAIVMMITASANIDDMEEAYKNGCDEYIKKPFHINELILRIEHWLKIKKSEPEPKKEEIKPQLPLFFVNTPNSYPHFFATLQ